MVGNAAMNAAEGGSEGNAASSAPAAPVFDPLVHAWVEWCHANPRSSYPGMTLKEYVIMTIYVGYGMGALDEQWLHHAQELEAQP
jgi:hypothetical protein